MMKSNFYKLSLLIILAFLISCNSDDDSIEPISTENLIHLTIDNQEYKAINENVGGNENCGNLHVSSAYYDQEKNIDYGLHISLSDTGQLLDVKFEERQYPSTSGNYLKYYFTPNFNPTKSFSISNFNYNPENMNLTFDFSGVVYFEEDNDQKKELSGSVDMSFSRSIGCAVPNIEMSYSSQDFHLYSYRHVRTQYNDGSERHRFFSNNGYILDINVNESFWNFPVDSIEFDQNSFENKVFLEKQLGEALANQLPNMNDHEWLNYDTEGHIIIEEKIIEDGYKTIIGQINLTAIEDNTISHSLEGIKFRTVSFEN